MPIDYITDINKTDKDKILLLIDASIQAYNAFNQHEPTRCRDDKLTAPAGFEFVECWSGVDAIFGYDKSPECYGVVFRSLAPPYTYVFAFRGTASIMDMLDDLGMEHQAFVPYDSQVTIPSDVAVERGFNDVYRTSEASTPSMQQQLFGLIDKYQASEKPIAALYITGHSLGAALSELFTLDVALSRPALVASTVNFAAPRVGKKGLVDFYEKQDAQQNPQTRTLRVQNTYDMVPCVPPEDLGYQQTSHAYLVAFFKEGWLGKLELADSHSAQNYFAVLRCAAGSEQGMCICEDLNVPANGYEITSTEADVDSVCSLW